MPRPVSRRYQPYLNVLRQITLDEQQPIALRLRSAELCIALLSGVWEVAASRVTQRAVRQLTAQDAIDEQLLGLTGMTDELRQQTKQAPTPEQERETELDKLLARATEEKKGSKLEQKKIEQLKQIAVDTAFSEDLRQAVKEQLAGLGQPVEPDKAPPPPEQPPAEDSATKIKNVFDDVIEQQNCERAKAEKQAKDDKELHACNSCFYMQPQANAVCALCGATDDWLSPSAVNSNTELAMFSRMAHDSDVMQLKVALQSGWAGWDQTGKRQRVAERILEARETQLQAKREADEQQRQLHEESDIANSTSVEYDDNITREQIQSAIAHIDLQLEELRQSKEKK